MLVKLQNSIFTLSLSLYNIQLTFTITHTHFVLFQLHLNHQIDINQNPQLNSLALIDSEALIKEMQRTMVNYDESQVLGATNGTTLTLQNYM